MPTTTVDAIKMLDKDFPKPIITDPVFALIKKFMWQIIQYLVSYLPHNFVYQSTRDTHSNMRFNEYLSEYHRYSVRISGQKK